MKYYLSLSFFFMSLMIYSQDQNYITHNIAINDLIDGTLIKPNSTNKPKLAIIIADAGPTDRNGNQNFQKNNAHKKLSEGLSSNGIATFRYDKRIVKQILKNKVDPTIKFDDYVTDAISVIDYFKNENMYSQIYVIGHGQGSLIGMLAAKDRADGFISIAGSHQPIDLVITQQIAAMDSSLVPKTKKAFKSLKEGKTTRIYPQALASIFKPDVQPFIMNWMQYDPQEALILLDIPILIINGTKDLQVSVNETTLLKNASDKAEIKIIKDMNHVFFIIDGDELVNSKSYNESFHKISEELISTIVSFLYEH